VCFFLGAIEVAVSWGSCRGIGAIAVVLLFWMTRSVASLARRSKLEAVDFVLLMLMFEVSLSIEAEEGYRLSNGPCWPKEEAMPLPIANRSLFTFDPFHELLA
jgi:hypothetical protein